MKASTSAHTPRHFGQEIIRFMRARCFSAAVTAALSSTISLNAEILAEYSFTGVSYASTDANSFSLATDLTRGSGFASAGGITPNFGNPAPSLAVRANTTPETEALAVAGDNYFAFTISPNPGYKLDLETLTLDFDANDPATEFGYSVRSSVDGFAATLLTYSEPPSTATAGTYVNESADLSAATFQDLVTPTTFRIYVFDQSSSLTRVSFFDNVILNGTSITVPEPATITFLAIGIVGLLGRRRRQTDS